jgi:hypothetical protein
MQKGSKAATSERGELYKRPNNLITRPEIELISSLFPSNYSLARSRLSFIIASAAS